MNKEYFAIVDRKKNTKSLLLMATPKKLFVWKESTEKMLLRMVVVEEPYKFKAGTRERGAAWNTIAEDLQKEGLKVTQRSVREKFEKMLREHKKKEEEEAKASGVDTDYGEIYQAMTDIKERITEFEELREGEEQKKQKEKTTAEDMRKKATEKLGETKRRKSDSADSEDGEEPKIKRPSGNGRSGILEILKESVEVKRKEQEEQRELRRKEFELREAELKQQQQLNMEMMSTMRELIQSLRK